MRISTVKNLPCQQSKKLKYVFYLNELKLRSLKSTLDVMRQIIKHVYPVPRNRNNGKGMAH